MATTMKDLFDDSSSSEDEEEKAETSETEAPAVDASPVRRVIQEEEDDEDSEDAKKKVTSETETNEMGGEEKEEMEKPASEAEAETPSTPAEAEDTTNTEKDTAPTRPTIHDDDDDDEDVEFNDDGVVGSSAPTATESTGANTPSSTSKRPAKKPRHISVLESDRPPAGTSLYITKLPNLVGIQTEPFDPDTYSASLEEQDYNGYVHSMIRWRYAKDEEGNCKRDADGKLVRESNARLVAWDDGNGGPKSFTLHVGNEVFEVDANDSSSNGFAGLNGYLYLSQTATSPEDNHSPQGAVLESMGAFQSRLVARPSSLTSEAHKKHTVAVRQKTIKKARIAEYVTQEDPEKAKQDRIKIKQDLEKASARKRSSSGYTRRPAMNRRYLEQDDGNYDSVNIKDLKRRGRDMDEDDMDYGEDSEEEEEDDSMFNRRRPKRPSRQQQEDDDEEDELVFDEESDDDEQVIKATSRKKLQHQALLDDDDE